MKSKRNRTNGTRGDGMSGYWFKAAVQSDSQSNLSPLQFLDMQSLALQSFAFPISGHAINLSNRFSGGGHASQLGSSLFASGEAVNAIQEDVMTRSDDLY